MSRFLKRAAGREAMGERIPVELSSFATASNLCRANPREPMRCRIAAHRPEVEASGATLSMLFADSRLARRVGEELQSC